MLLVAAEAHCFSGNRVSGSFSALPLLSPSSLKCFFCLTPLHQHAGTHCFCTVGVGNLQRGFPALLFRPKSLQSSIATWIKKKERKKETSTLLFSKPSQCIKRLFAWSSHIFPFSPSSGNPCAPRPWSLDMFPSHSSLVCKDLIH